MIDMEWKEVRTEEDVDHIEKRSYNKTCLIYKHSTRCSLSAVVKNRLERNWDISEKDVDIFYLDIIAYRHLSNKLSEHYLVIHESPQILVIDKGKCIYSASHSVINVNEIHAILEDGN